MEIRDAFVVYVGPSMVKGAAEAVRSAGLEVDEGTERIYVSGPVGDRNDCRAQIWQKLRAALGDNHFLTREFR